jgi:hypothetical protein
MPKSFEDFILILEEKKGRGGPDYNYEVALANLYNHLIKGGDKGNARGKLLRGAVSRGDMNTVTDILADELNKAKTDPKHPLHFNNADNEGFTGKAGKTEEHKDAYYKALEDQQYTFLNDIQSRIGKNLVSQGYIVKRQGAEQAPLSKTGQKAYGKKTDTSKPDIVFQHPTRPERVNYTSLKKASGAVSASSGAEETAGNYTVGMNAALNLALKSGRITKDQKAQLEKDAGSKITQLRDVMSSSKGMSKEQQKDLLPQIDKIRGEIEKIVPGTERETGKEQLSGKGKYQQSVNSFLSTGRGGGRKQKPEEVSGTHQRARLGKGTSKTAAGPVQRPVTMTGDIKKPVTGEPSSFSSFSRQSSEAQKALADAEREQASASVITTPNGKPVPRKNQYYLQNNPGAAQQYAAKKELAAQAVDTARTTLDTIRQRAVQAQAAAQERRSKPQPQPQPQTTQPIRPEPQQQKPQPQPQPQTQQPTQSTTSQLQQTRIKKKLQDQQPQM